MNWQGHVSDRQRPARLHFLEVVRGKETVTMFIGRKTAAGYAPSCRMSLAYLSRTASSYSIFNCKIPLVRLKVAGCATRSLTLWAGPSRRTRAPVGSLHPRLCLSWETAPTSPLLLILLLRPGHFPSRNPPRAAKPSGSHNPSCRIVPQRRTFREGSFANHDFSFSGPSHAHVPSFTKQLAKNRPIQFPNSLGTDSRCVVLPRCHTNIRLTLPLPLSL